MRRCEGKRGQSLVEFALVLPLLVLLLYGLAEFGFLLYAHVQVTNAAREGARAGSLYLGSRFHYTVASGDDCWTMQRWVENALVQHNRDGKGCPQSTYSTAIHAFGLLSSTPCTSAGQMNCWTLQPLKINNTTITDTPAWIGDRVGDPLLVEVIYRYEMPLLGGVFNANPIQIQKRVIMRMQNN
ncbi:MAG TPA: TadE family protein [Herpetosiphonaceae bacterium]